MVNHAYIQPINQRGNFPLPRTHRSSWTRRWHPGSPRETLAGKRGPFHSHSCPAKKALYVFVGGENHVREGSKKNSREWWHTWDEIYLLFVSCCAKVDSLFSSGNQRYTHWDLLPKTRQHLLRLRFLLLEEFSFPRPNNLKLIFLSFNFGLVSQLFLLVL